MRKLFLSVAFIGVAFAANAQKSEVAEAKKAWSLYDLTLSQPEVKRAPRPEGGEGSIQRREVGKSSTTTRSNQVDRNVLIGGTADGIINSKDKRADERITAARKPDPTQAPKPRPSTYVGKQLAALYAGLEHTDKAIANEKSKVMPEAWTYRALFAASAAYVDTLDVANSLKYQGIAEEAIAKAKSLKPSSSDNDDIKSAETILTNAQRTRGVVAFNRNDLKAAYDIFKDISAKNVNDTAMYANLGFLARELKDYPASIGHYKKAIAINAPDAALYYGEIIKMDLETLKDTTAAKMMLEEASVKFPDDMFFVTNLTDLYMKAGNTAKADALLDKLIAKEPKNPVFLRAKANGYFNQAFDLQAPIRKLEDAKKFKEADAMIKKKTEFLNLSLPLYLRVEEIAPKDEDLIKMIKQIYFVLDNKPKVEEYQKKQDALK